MGATSADTVEYLTLVAACIAAAAPVLNWWHERSKNSEVFDVGLEWRWGPSYYGGDDEHPMVVVHNRTNQDIAITQVKFYTRPFWRKPDRYTAVAYDDPSDLSFPYIVKSGEIWMHRMDIGNLAERFSKMRLAVIFSKFGRPSIWIGVQTMRGSTRLTSAENIIPVRLMPAWLQRKFEDA